MGAPGPIAAFSISSSLAFEPVASGLEADDAGVEARTVPGLTRQHPHITIRSRATKKVTGQRCHGLSDAFTDGGGTTLAGKVPQHAADAFDEGCDS